MKICPYSFRTYPNLNELRIIFPDLFVFDKLKDNLKTFCSRISQHHPNIILGIAKSRTPHSQFEPLAINKFHKHKKVDKNAPLRYRLYLPNTTSPIFRVSKNPSDSFCNWTMFKISHFLHTEKIDSKLAFVHLHPKDSKHLLSLFPNLH